MNKTKEKYNKYYYDYDRNLDNAKMSNTLDIVKTENLLSNDIPEYYKGKEGYEARKVCDNFDLTYHLATATTYILRAYRKHDTPIECLRKAIAHLEFELDKIKREKNG